MTFLQYLSVLYRVARKAWNDYKFPELDTIRPHAQYFLSDNRPFTLAYDVVPEGLVYVEDWVQEGHKKSVVRYGGEQIPKSWTESPFDKNAKSPWVWVGDRETEIDLTRTFNKFLVVGNRITAELVRKLINVTERTNLIYIESGTFKELKFPGDGLTIEEYDDRPVQSRG